MENELFTLRGDVLDFAADNYGTIPDAPWPKYRWNQVLRHCSGGDHFSAFRGELRADEMRCPMIFTSPILETERCILRPLSTDDAEAVFQWAGDERVNTFMPYNKHRSPEDSRAWLKGLETLENEYQWGFVRKSDGLLMGSGGMRLHTDDGSWSFGYNFRFDCWGKGYATEVTGRMIGFIREKHDPERITAEHAVDNPASGRVMEKCGLFWAENGEYSTFDGTKTFKSRVYHWNKPRFFTDRATVVYLDNGILLSKQIFESFREVQHLYWEHYKADLGPMDTDELAEYFLDDAGSFEPVFERQEIEDFVRSPETVLAKYDE